jgi:hypothetical protein
MKAFTGGKRESVGNTLPYLSLMGNITFFIKFERFINWVVEAIPKLIYLIY